MRQKVILCILLCLSMAFEGFSQVSISGKVSDDSGIGIPGVNVIVKGTMVGTLTDSNGSYVLQNVPGGSNAVLVFSFVGFISQEVPIGSQRVINVVLKEEISEIDEVVVVAYGTTKKKDLTGSISTVDGNLIAKQANSTITRALEGAVAGLQVAAVDGQPGLDMGIRLRGIGTASQNNSNALVESVTVLKDAASTALYGSRGANGVVLITTKKGKSGDAKISFEGRWGVNQVGPYQYDKINKPKDIYEFAWLSIYNSVRSGVDGSGISKNYTTNLKNPNMSLEEAANFASAHLFDYTGSTTKFTRNALGNWMLYNVPGAVYTPTGSGATASATMSSAYLVNPDSKLNPNTKLLYNDYYDKYVLENRFRQNTIFQPGAAPIRRTISSRWTP